MRRDSRNAAKAGRDADRAEAPGWDCEGQIGRSWVPYNTDGRTDRSDRSDAGLVRHGRKDDGCARFKTYVRP